MCARADNPLYKEALGLREVKRHTSRAGRVWFFKAPGSEELIEICKFDESGPVQVGPDLTTSPSRSKISTPSPGMRRPGYPVRRTDAHGQRQRDRLRRRPRGLRTELIQRPKETNGIDWLDAPFDLRRTTPKEIEEPSKIPSASDFFRRVRRRRKGPLLTRQERERPRHFHHLLDGRKTLPFDLSRK
jgi:lactoylglutathione lyase